MKKLVLTLLCCMAFAITDAQVYKMDEVWKAGNQLLLCRKDALAGDGHRFILCDVKYYLEGVENPFISVYYEGGFEETAAFLNEVLEFLEEYWNQDGIMTEIHGRRVYRVRKALAKGLYIFENDGRHFGGYRDGWIERMQRSFEDYCRREKLM